jgi:uncharacterized phage protein (TIGR01671 family)
MNLRDIEFRGKRKDNGKWKKGDLIRYGLDTFIAEGPNYDICPDEVIPKTVGRYTGMKDGKDNKIFEGDIIQDKSEKKNYLVVYCSVDACFCLVESIDWNPVQARSRPLGRRNDYYIKVIGSIHDNPDLLHAGGGS